MSRAADPSNDRRWASVRAFTGMVALAPFFIFLLCLTSSSSSFADTRKTSAPPAGAAEGTSAEAIKRGRVVTRGGVSFSVEVVSDPRSRERGLQHRASVPDGTGMLFVFPAPGRHRFWMYECLTAIDMVWLDATRRVVHLEERVPPCAKLPCQDYGPEEEALYVLEVGPGVARKAGIHRGETLTLLFSEPPNPT